MLVSLKGSGEKAPSSFDIPWSVRKTKPLAQIQGADTGEAPRLNPQLVQAIVRAHQWLGFLTDGTHDSIESLARAVDLHPKVIRNRIRLAFLRPTLTRDLLNGTRSVSASLNELACGIRLSWTQQQDQLARVSEDSA